MAKRFGVGSEFSVNGTHVVIDRSISYGAIEIRIWREWGNGEYRYLNSEGQWIEAQELEPIPPTVRLRHDVLEILKAALNEEETPAIQANALLAEVLKTETTRVDKLLDHLLNGGTNVHE